MKRRVGQDFLVDKLENPCYNKEKTKEVKIMENKCNDWECPYNKDGKCTQDECVSWDISEILNAIRKEK